MEHPHDWQDLSTDALLAAFYKELYERAMNLMGRERPDHTLSPTAVLNETWMSLKGAKRWKDKAHFMAYASTAMRSILVDHARERLRLKRAGAWTRVALDDQTEIDATDEDLVAIDDAITVLKGRDALAAQVVQFMYYGGLKEREVAHVLGLSQAEVARLLRYARGFLGRQFGPGARDRNPRPEDGVPPMEA